MRTNTLTHDSLHNLVKVQSKRNSVTDFNKTFKINPKLWHKKDNVNLPSIQKSQSVINLNKTQPINNKSLPPHHPLIEFADKELTENEAKGVDDCIEQNMIETLL